MNILYIIFIIMMVYTVMYAVLSFLSALVPSLLLYHHLIKNKKRYCEYDKEENGKKITLILNLERNINEFILKINSLVTLDYENYDIYIVASEKNLYSVKKIIDVFNLEKKEKNFNYQINKDEIISLYSNGKINLLNKEKSNIYNNINAVIDNIQSDLFMVIEEGIFPQKNALNKLAREFMLNDNTLFNMGVIKNDTYIQRQGLNFEGIKTHNFFQSAIVLKGIKNKLFLKTFNYEFCDGYEEGNNFVMYNLEKVRNVGGFSNKNINPNNSLKQKLVDNFGGEYFMDYEALAIKESGEIKDYLDYEIKSTYFNRTVEKSQNSFLNAIKVYGFLSKTLASVLDLIILVFSLVLAFIGVITFEMFFSLFIIYISFETIKNILLVISDKISMKNSKGFLETLELIGYCIIYNFGLRQFYNLHALSIRFHKDERMEEYYSQKELFGYQLDDDEIINEKLTEEVERINYKEIILNSKNKSLNVDNGTNKEKEQNKETVYIDENEPKELEIPEYEIDDIKESEDYSDSNELNDIINEINEFEVKDEILNENDDALDEEGIDEILDKPAIYTVDEENLEDAEQLTQSTKKEELSDEKKKSMLDEESELMKIMKRVEQTYNKIEELEKAVNKELNDIDRRSGYSDINEKIDNLKKEVLDQEKNIDSVYSNKKDIAVNDVKASDLDDLSMEEIDEEFKNIII